MNLAQLVGQGDVNPLFLFSAALVLGALHGLEPGHSKTMMAAFIVAVQGTIAQAAILGLCAAFSHTIIVWILALLALTYGNELIAEDMEPWFMAASGLLVLAIAAWMAVRIHRNRAAHSQHGSSPQHRHHQCHDHGHTPGSSDNHSGHVHSSDHPQLAEDSHARTHARNLEQRFASGRANLGQVMWFGLVGGLIPCPAAVTVLIVCLHLQQFWLGVGLVGSFSVGLALTLVTVGAVVAWGLSMARRRSSKVDAFFAAAPYLSVLLIAIVGALMLAVGLAHLHSTSPA